MSQPDQPLSKTDVLEPKEQPRTTVQNVVLVMVITLCMINLIQAQSSLNVALPQMGRDLGIPDDQLEWPLTAYALAFGCLILFTGRLADIIGPRTMWLSGSALFAVFNLAAGLAQNAISQYIFRALQGAGAAAAVPASVSILAHTFPSTSPYRAIAFACFSAGAPVGSGLGSIFGGIFTQLSSWRHLFFYQAGIAVIPCVAGWFVCPPEVLDPKRDKRIDYFGAFLSTAGLVLLTFALSSGQTAPNQWKTGYIIALLIVSVILIGLFLAWEHYLATSSRFTVPPLLKLEIFRRAKLRYILLVGLCAWAAFQPLLYHATLFFQQYQGLTPIQTMVRFLPTAVSGVLCNFAFALLVPYAPGWSLLLFGAAGTSVASLLFAVIDPDVTYWAFAFPSTALSVFGADFIYATSTIYIASIAEKGEQGLTSGLFQVFTQLGVALGLAVSTVVSDAVQDKEVAAGHTAKEALLKGLKAAQWTAFTFATLAGLIIILALRSIKILGHKRGKKHAAAALDDSFVQAEGKIGDDLEGGVRPGSALVQEGEWEVRATSLSLAPSLERDGTLKAEQRSTSSEKGEKKSDEVERIA